MGRKVKEIVLILIAVLFLNNNFSLSHSGQKDIVEEANLLLDMMEYEAAIVNYMKVLSRNPQQRNIRKEIGYAYYQLEKVDDALNYLKEELNLFLDNGDAYDLLVYILYKLNKLHDANNFLERLDFPVRLTEDNPLIGGLACFILGVYFKELEKYDKAEIYFRKALEKGHDGVKCYVQLIDIEISRKKLDTFNIKFKPALKLLASDGSILAEGVEVYKFRPEFLFLIGIRLFENYSWTATRAGGTEPYLIKAVETFKLALKLYPNFKGALYNLACISYNFKDFKKASEYFRKILDIDPEDKKVRGCLDCCLQKLDKSADKEVISEQCPKWIDLSREFIDKPDREYKYQYKNDVSFVFQNINNLALEFIRNGKFHEGLKRFLNGLKMNPDSPGIHFNMGMVYSWLDDFNEAEKYTLIALRKKDFFGSIPAYRRKEILKEKKRSIKKPAKIPLSEWTFDVALKEGNYFSDAYNSLGTLYFKRKEYDKSILAFKKVIEIFPGDAMGHYNLSCTYWEIGDKKNAEKEWKAAIRYEEELKRMKKRGEISEDQLEVSLIVLPRPVSFRSHKFLGRLYLEQNSPNKALKEFEKALKLEPDDPEPYYEIGKIYHAKSEFNEKYVRKAISYYEKYLFLGGGKEEKVKELLKSLK